MVQSLSENCCSCCWTVSCLRFCCEVRALWKVILVAAQLLFKNKEICFLVLYSHVIKSLILHWRYAHIKFRHWRNFSAHESYISSSSFLILSLSGFDIHVSILLAQTPFSEKSSFLLLYIDSVLIFVLLAFLATLSEILSFYFEAYFCWSLSCNIERYRCSFCSILETSINLCLCFN
jgi:hypothetical protein